MLHLLPEILPICFLPSHLIQLHFPPNFDWLPATDLLTCWQYRLHVVLSLILEQHVGTETHKKETINA